MKLNIKFDNLKSVFAILLIASISISCDDLVEEIPISEISPEGFYQTNSDIEGGVIGIYDAMQGNYNNRHFLWGEFRSDNHAPFSLSSTNLNNLEIVNNSITQGNPAVRWNELYRLIDRANQVIVNAPQVEGLNEDFLAEALALRAKAYFDAVRVWGDVPLFTKPVRAASEAQVAVTDRQTILNDIIIPDLIQAQELMVKPSDKFRFSKASIYALQAEVYAWVNDYPSVKTALDDLIALGQYSLVTTPEDWDNMFYNNPPTPAFPDGEGKIQEGTELILSIRYDLDESLTFGGTRNRSSVMGLFFTGIPSFVISPEVENKWREKFPIEQAEWEAKYPDTDPVLTRDDGSGQEVAVYGDWRYYFTREGRVEAFESVDFGRARTAKWNQTNYPGNIDDTDIVLYRYADVLLLLAEAENELSTDGGRALDLVNQIRTARQLPLVKDSEFGSTKEDRLDYILDERQLELFGEGKRWWDLLRNDKAIEILNPILSQREGGGVLTQDRLLWPILDFHLIDNPLLEQNPGY